MNFKNWKEGERSETPLDRKLDDLLTRAMEVRVPESLIDRTMERLPEAHTAPFPWWAWAVYVGFFATTVLGLAYWQWGALVALATRAALAVPKGVALAAQYPYVALLVAGAFFLNALLVWFIAADLVLRKRLAGVMAP
ncbi:hypothetical protein MYX82_00705 [Acidobacteria bacterium AH-259-D05]|nr:hypothetical protein [Acidobacteria bacterium AH-259-D05]